MLGRSTVDGGRMKEYGFAAVGVRLLLAISVKD